jgi:signal transduction histidine kinase
VLELTAWALGLLAATAASVLAVALFGAHRKLRSAAERSHLRERVLDAIPEALFVVDALQRGRPNIHVNAAYSALTGYAAREALAGNFDALSIFADAAQVAALGGRADAAAGVQVSIRRRDGATLPATLDLRVLPRADGGRYLVGLLAAESDERADRAAAAPLVEKLSNAGATVHPTGPFLSWLIHELRSPLNACVMWLDVLALAPQPDKLAKAVEALKRGLARQARLVSDLNDAVKISPASEMRRERFDLVALLKRGLDAWQALAAAKQLAFVPLIEIGAGDVDGDPEQVLQALSHVVENAIGSTPSGGRLELKVHAVGRNCLVEVEDTGDALSPEDSANLFTPLWRGSTSAKARSGLGLGLAVAHQIAVHHGGTLAASNGVVGARFVLTLPLAAVKPA